MNGTLLTVTIFAGIAILVALAVIIGRIDAHAQRQAHRRLAATSPFRSRSAGSGARRPAR